MGPLHQPLSFGVARTGDHQLRPPGPAEGLTVRCELAASSAPAHDLPFPIPDLPAASHREHPAAPTPGEPILTRAGRDQHRGHQRECQSPWSTPATPWRCRSARTPPAFNVGDHTTRVRSPRSGAYPDLLSPHRVRTGGKRGYRRRTGSVHQRRATDASKFAAFPSRRSAQGSRPRS